MELRKQYENGVVSHVTVKHTGLNPEQNFSHRLVEQAVVDGWINVIDGKLIMKTDAEPLVFDLKRVPGYYVKGTTQRIPISDIAWTRMRATGIGDLSRKEALAWLLSHGMTENDYEVTNAYECVLNSAQHNLFRGVSGPAGKLVAAHTLEG